MFAASTVLKRASTAVATVVVCRTRFGVSTKQLQQQRGLASSAHKVEGLVEWWMPPVALTLMGLALVSRHSGSALPPTSDERGFARKVGWDNFTQKSVKMTDDDYYDDDDDDDDDDDEDDADDADDEEDD